MKLDYDVHEKMSKQLPIDLTIFTALLCVC